MYFVRYSSEDFTVGRETKTNLWEQCYTHREIWIFDDGGTGEVILLHWVLTAVDDSELVAYWFF